MVRNVVAVRKQWANFLSILKSCCTHRHTHKQKTNCVFCIPACDDGSAACKRRENPEGEHRSFFAQPYVSMYNLTEHGWRFTCWSVCFVLFWFLRVSGDSFVVNAFLRRGMEECERYSATDHKLKNMQVALRLFFFFLRVIFLLISSPWQQNQLALMPPVLIKIKWKGCEAIELSL